MKMLEIALCDRCIDCPNLELTTGTRRIYADGKVAAYTKIHYCEHETFCREIGKIQYEVRFGEIE